MLLNEVKNNDVKNIFKILLIIYFNFAVGFNKTSIPNILENNHDLKLLQNIIIENGGTYKLRGIDNTTEIVTLDQIRKFENGVNNLSSVHQNKLTVKNFFLFTRNYHSGLKYEILDPLNITSVKNSHFATRKTYILVHGFLGDGLEAWILNLKDKLLSKKDSNVISVDWPAGYKWFLPSYLSALGKVPYVGNDTAFLIDTLMKYKGLLLEDIHSIGHSLGAHITGFAAKPFSGRIGKISGLDPAGPYFRHLDSSKRLDKKDAFYVDVIHTNACNDSLYWMDCFGLNENIGHSDFYPSGGEHQPACAKKKKGFSGEIGCDHEMAYLYYISSLDFKGTTTYFLARPCDEWDHYVNGNCSCGKKAQYMGFNVNTEIDGLFYLKTLPFPPYGVQDPSCPSSRGVGVMLIFGYLFLVTMVAACFYSTMYVVFKSVKRTCCSTQFEEEESLVSSDTSSSISSSISSSNIGDEEEDCLQNSNVVIEQGEERILQERPYTVET